VTDGKGIRIQALVGVGSGIREIPPGGVEEEYPAAGRKVSDYISRTARSSPGQGIRHARLGGCVRGDGSAPLAL